MSDNIEIKVTDSIDSRVASKLRAIASEAKAAHNSVELLKSALASTNMSALGQLSKAAKGGSSVLQEQTAELRAMQAQVKQNEAHRMGIYKMQKASLAREKAARNAMMTEALAMNREFDALRQKTVSEELAVLQEQTAELRAMQAQVKQNEAHRMGIYKMQKASLAREKAARNAMMTEALAMNREFDALRQRELVRQNAVNRDLLSQQRQQMAGMHAEALAMNREFDAKAKQLLAAKAAMASEAQQLRASLYPAEAAQQAHIASMEKAQRLYRAGAIDLRTYADAIQASNNRFAAAQQPVNGFNDGLANAGKQARLSRHHMINLGYQIQDIGVSLASGQKPLTVFIQQGAQIAGIMAASEMSAKALAGAIWQLVRPFAPLVAALGTAYASYKLLTNEIAKQNGLEQYAKNLGATQKQIEELNLDTVTLTDVVKGLWATFGDTSLGKAFLETLSLIKESVSLLASEFFKMTAKGTVAFFELQNRAVSFLEALWNAPDRAMESGASAAAEFSKAYKSNLESNRELILGTTKDVFAYIDELAGKTSGNIGEAAKKRIKEELDKANEKELQTLAENRAALWKKTTEELQNQIDRMFLYKSVREKQAKLDQIEERFIGRRMELRKGELIQIREYIDTIYKGEKVAAKMDEITQQAMGAKLDYNNSSEALAYLQSYTDFFDLPENAGKYELFVKNINKEFAKGTDALFAFNEERKKATALMGLVGDELEVEARLYDLVADAESRKLVLNKESTRTELEQALAIDKKAAAIQNLYNTYAKPRIERRDKIQAIQELQNPEDRAAATASELGSMGVDTTFFATQLASEEAYYKERLNLFRQYKDEKLISEREMSAAELQISLARQQKYLNAASNFFGDLSSLQRVEHKQSFKIGKAAAIAQATVNTYLSATGAYAALAPVHPALGAIAAGAAITAGLVNVAAIRAQEPAGFMLGGYTGNVGRQQVAGVVHGQEYVFDAEATNRIGVDNLEALRNSARQMGSTSTKSSSTGIGGVIVNIENYGVSKQFEVQQISRDEVRVIARDEAEASVSRLAPSIIASDISNPNSKVSKSLAASTTTARRR